MAPIDYAFTPRSYWDHPDPIVAILAQVKGQERRDTLRRILLDTATQDLPDELMDDTAPPGLQTMLEGLGPQWMGGEYLPDCRLGEVEIARIVLKSTTQDVYSLRAQRDGDTIRYRMVDEYETVFQLPQAESPKPLTLRELIAIIDGASCEGLESGDLTDQLRDGTSAEDLDEGVAFVRVESAPYPELATHYYQKAHTWAQRRRHEMDDGRNG